jgi:large subunit ribosomal protein L10
MKTKIQKTAQIEGGLKRMESSKTMLFADFTGTPVNDMNSFRKSLHAAGAKFEVFKKRLLRVAFEKKGIQVNPEDFTGQVGVAFSPESIESVAGAAYGFSKQAKTFRILGGFDLAGAKFFTGEEVTAIGMLPPREVLLAQVVGTMAAPMSALLYVLQERAKQVQ